MPRTSRGHVGGKVENKLSTRPILFSLNNPAVGTRMKYTLLEIPTLQASECLVIGVFTDSELPDFAKKLDLQYNQIITRLMAKLGEVGDLIWQADIEGHSLVLLHCGNHAKFTHENLRKCLNNLIPALNKQRITTATFCLPK